MECPNCNFALQNEKICPNCGTDIVLINKIFKISYNLYNKGLLKAEVHDFYGAIEALNKSISFYKGNIEARNLLGLVYFETGNIGEAFKHWVISSNFKKENNIAKEYIDSFQKDMRVFEKYDDSTRMYNQAVIYIKQNSDDMAVIQLKKAIDLNPKFVDAHNLLALCYLIQGLHSDADKVIQNVLSIDINNPISLNYYKELHPDKVRPESKISKNSVVVKESKPAYADIVRTGKRRTKGNSRVMEFVTFVIGCVCVAAVMFILIIPGIVDTKQGEIDTLKNDFNTMQSSYSELKTNTEQQISSLEEENKNLKIQVDDFTQKVDIQNRVDKIDNASSLYSDGNTKESADALLSMNVTGLPDDAVEKYNNLKQKVLPQAAKNQYNSGKREYDKKNYEEAKGLLSSCLLYAGDVPVTKYNAMYYLGRIAVNEGDNEKAKEYLQQVSDNHPTSSMKRNADNLLKNL